MKKILLLSAITVLTFLACKKEDQSTEWLIPSEEVQDGGPGKDGIPSIDNPQFVDVDDVDFLSDFSLVVGVLKDGEIKAYPHRILDWHEIVNDEIGSYKFALNYCPLTGTALAWNREINGSTTTFGVSGKLYNNNIIPYDRETDSYWSQIALECVNGDLIGTVPETYPIIETYWMTWKKMYPDSKILSTQTGFDRNYENYPYGNYRTNHDYFLFPRNPFDNRLPSKERVLGVLNNGANKVYSITNFETEAKVIYDKLGDDDVMVIGSGEDNWIAVFYDDGTLQDFTLDLSAYPVIGTDANGNQLEISGKISAGPLAGTQLEIPNSFMGYFFSFGSFYPDIEIYTE